MWQCEGFPDPLSVASKTSQERLIYMAQAAITAVLGTFDLEALKTLIGDIEEVRGRVNP
jgi:hypothetical protein